MILEVKNVHKDFVVERGAFKKEDRLVKAIDDISFGVNEFSTLGIVGESGSGKTTLAKIILNLIPLTSGQIIFNVEKITNFRKDVQIIFQNPYNSLSPKMHIFDMLSEPLIIHRIVSANLLKDRAIELLRLVGLDENALNRLPIEFSGGQRQRICIARALASNPKFLVLDEPISSLDLTIQAQMLDLFRDLKNKLRLTYIFISHNLAIVKHIADRVLIMQNGRIIEEGKSEDIFHCPKDPYTVSLLNAAKS